MSHDRSSAPLDNERSRLPSLGEVYPLEQARCRDLLAEYKALGPVGQFGYHMISQVLERADRAAIGGDVVAMLRSFEEMKGCR